MQAEECGNNVVENPTLCPNVEADSELAKK